MDLAQLHVFNMLKTNMVYNSERQAVLAHNVANADTPKYRAKDVEKPNFKRMMQYEKTDNHLFVTDTKHMQIHRPATVMKVVKQPDGFEQTPVENNVVLEEEVLKMNETADHYARTSALYRKMTDMMKSTLGSR